MTGIGRRHGRVAVGHPVDVASGTFFDTQIDHVSAGIVPLSLARTYSTDFIKQENFGAAAAHGPTLPFGPGWRADWQAELRKTLDGFTYTTPDGATFALVNPRAGGFNVTGRLVDPALGIELRRIDDRRVMLIGFDLTRSRLSLIFDLSSDGIQYNLVSVMATKDARLDVYRDTSGRVVTLHQTRERRQYEIAYDGDRVIGVQLRLADQSSRLAASYGYDAQGRLVEVRDERGVVRTYAYDDLHRIVHEAQRGGTTYTVRYRSDGRCIYVSGGNRYQERTLRYDVESRQTWVFDSHGQATHYQWNEHGQVMQTTSPMGVQTRAEFDDDGRIVRQTLPSGSLVEYEYDETGKRVATRFPGGRETRMYHDDQHRLVRIEESTGARLRYTYDEDNNPIAVYVNDLPPWQYQYNTFGETTEIRAPSGAAAYVTYDAYGGVSAETDYDGNTWQWGRDVLGRALWETDALGSVRRIEYLDDFGSMRLIEPDGRVLERHVSADERTVVMRLPGGATTSLQFSSCGQPIELRDAEGAITTLTWGSEPGELLTIENANRQQYTVTYDADMRMVERRTFDGRHIRTEWDRDRVAATVDTMGNRFEYEYDERGYLIRRLGPEGLTEYAYDKYGNMASIETPESRLRLEWDDQGHIIAEEQDGVRVERKLDVMGQPIAHVTPFGEISRFTWTPGGQCVDLRYRDTTIHFGWNALGQETSRSLPGAGVFEHVYDSCGRLAGQAFRREGQPDGAPSFMRQFAYDQRGYLASIEDSLRGRRRLLHDNRGDLVGVVRDQGASEFYEYDLARNRTLQANTDRGAEFARALETAGYHALLQVLGGIPAESFRSSYAPGNRLVTVEGVRKKIELTYDANGQVVSKSVIREDGKQDLWQYEWNSRGQLVGLEDPKGGRWAYRYDGCGRRISKKSPTGFVWTYVWIGDLLVHVLRDGELGETYVHEPYGTCPILRDDGAVHYILPDQAQAPSEEVDAAGTLTWAARKDTWGDDFSDCGTSGGEPFFGQWYDRESGLHYNTQRYYDPEIGRFLSPDPMDIQTGLHAYLGTWDPFTQYDRNGLVITPQSSTRYGGPYTNDQIDTSTVNRAPIGNQSRVKDTGKATINSGPDAGSEVNLQGNTLCSVSQGQGEPKFHTLNGTNNTHNKQTGQTNKDARTRPTGMDPAISPVTWNHAEMHAFNALLQGNAPGIERGGEPIRLDISRAPCTQKNGCDAYIKRLAAQVAEMYQTDVIIDWPPRTKNKPRMKVSCPAT
ncbi:DUF6531 domain-containing protein [Pendulispora brunnea]|uniref:DUF6531 domain-containing protein n=1 Tax=Pendulispora brunnea TaxID=2905690 RepID=A0ABZ2KH68_9BACT